MFWVTRIIRTRRNSIHFNTVYVSYTIWYNERSGSYPTPLLLAVLHYDVRVSRTVFIGIRRFVRTRVLPRLKFSGVLSSLYKNFSETIRVSTSPRTFLGCTLAISGFTAGRDHSAYIIFLGKGKKSFLNVRRSRRRKKSRLIGMKRFCAYCIVTESHTRVNCMYVMPVIIKIPYFSV